MKNNKQFYAILAENKKRILKVRHDCKDESGIYILTRQENNFKYAYIGQAKKVLTRLAQHLQGHKQRIDNSLYKRGLFSTDNLAGWQIQWFRCPVEQLDEKEQEYMLKYHNLAYQLYNGTSGGQGGGKFAIEDTVRKGYRQGVEYGYNKARKEIAHLFELHLTYDVKKQGNKVQEKAKRKFEEFIEIFDHIKTASSGTVDKENPRTEIYIEEIESIE